MANVATPNNGLRYLGITANPRFGRTAAQEQAYVDSQISPQAYQVIRRYHGWSNNLIDGYEATISAPRIPWIYWYPANEANTFTTYTSILSGSQDALINQNADNCIAYGNPMLLTFQMEPDHNTAAGTPSDFILAWRYVHDKFSARGVANVSWVLVLTAATYAASGADAYYPGDSYVDWLGADGYNWFTYHSSPWKLFADVFDSFRLYGITRGKPCAIGEFATVPDPADSTRKGQWYDDALATLQTTAWDSVKCACYFNSQPFPTSPPWWLDDDPSGTSPVAYPLAHWKTLASNVMWDVRVPTTWYVKTTGSDGAAGTSAGTAFATLTHAFSVALAGDSIYLMDAATPGTAVFAQDVNIASTAGTAAAPIYVQGCDSSGVPLPDDFWNRLGRPTWKGRHWLQSGFRHVRFRSILFDGRLVTNPTGSPNDPGLILDVQDVLWDYCSFTNHNVVDPVGRVMVKSNSGGDIHWNSCWFYEIGNMTNRTNTNQGAGGADTGFFQHAFYGGPLTSSSAIDCMFVHVAGRGLQFYGGAVDSFQTLRCAFVDCGTPAIIDSHSTNNAFQSCLFDGSLILGGVAAGSGGGGPGSGNSVSDSFFHGITGAAVGAGIASANNTTGGAAPVYVDATNYDYHLVAGSPGTGAGPRQLQAGGTVSQVGVIFFENKGRSAVLSGAPYFKTVDSTYFSCTNLEGTSAPSLPDYETFVTGAYAPNTSVGGSGGAFGGAPKGADGSTAWNTGYWGAKASLFSQLNTAGISWKTYEEGVTGRYNTWSVVLNNGSSNYLSRHCPASLFSYTTAPGVSHGKGRYDFDELAYDISHSSLPSFFIITPNSVNDGHDSGLAPADTWLQANLNNILNAMDANGLLIITFDNVPTPDAIAPITGTGVVYNVVAGRGVTHRSDGTYYTHHSTLKGIQNLFGLGNFSSGVDSHYTSATALPLASLGGGDTTPPTPPTVALTVLGATSIKAAMSGATDNVAVTGYEVSRSLHSAGVWAVVAPNTGTPYTDTGLVASTQYDYRARALDAAGNKSSYSTLQTATTGSGGDTTKPTAPSGLGATAAGSSQINLAWTAATDNVAVTAYKIYRDSGTGFTVLATIGNNVTYNDTGLPQNTFFSYEVSALDAAGNEGPFSNTAGATTSSTGGTDSITDTFARNASSSWGTSDDGHAWTIHQGVTSQFSVVSGQGGKITLVAGNAPIVTVDDISQQDYDDVMAYSFSALPTAGSQNITIAIRYLDVQNYTRLTITQAVGGHAQLGVDRQIANVNTSLGTHDTGAAQAIDTVYKARVQAIGTSVRARVWLASQAEPSTWDIDGVDTVAPVIAGGVGVRSQATSAYTGGGVYTVSNYSGAPASGVSGTTLIDDSGNGLDGLLIAGSSGILPDSVDGPQNDLALHFDGTGGRVEIRDTTNTLSVVNWTIAGWVKLDVNPGDTDPVHQRYEILEKAGSYWINVRYDTTPPYKVRTGSFFGGVLSGFDFIDSATALVPGTWYHVAGTYSGSALSVWINGVVSASKAKTGDSGGGTGEPLTIGAKHRYSGGELLEAFMHGSITGCAVFDKALSGAEITTLMNTTFPIWSDEAATFTPAAADIGYLLRAKQIATNRVGTASAVGPASSPITSAPGQSPQNVTAPTLSDTTPAEGQLITANQGSWTGTPTPTVSDTVQIASSSSGPWSNAAPPDQGYTIPTDGSAVGKFLSIIELASNNFGSATKRSPVSAAITAVGTGPPTNTAAPSLFPSSVAAGVTITSTEGTWTNIGLGDIAQYAFEEQDTPGGAVTVVRAYSASNLYIPSSSDVYLRSAVQHSNGSGTSTARSAWAAPSGNWVIVPIFPQPNTVVTNAIVDTSWQLNGVIPQGQAFYVRGDGGPWIPAQNTGSGVLTATVTLIGGDGQHLIEGDVH